MDSLVFKTACNTLGYFQKDGDICHICLDGDFMPEIKSFNWSDWEKYKSGPYAQHMPNSTLQDDLSKAISYFVWNFRGNISPNIVELNTSIFPAGIYCKRINRKSLGLFEEFQRKYSTIDEIRSFYNLVESLNSIFNVVEPDRINEHAFGHKIRELLTIACTEVEYLLLQILKENGHHAARYSTKDYVKILPLLKLNEYVVVLNMHPNMGEFMPFLNWNDTHPTQSLSWYSAYNSVKHDRGGNFRLASLGATINAIAAVHILLEAQYGEKLFSKPLYSNYESCFYTKVSPVWGTNEVFSPLIQDNEKILWKSNYEYFNLPIK